MHAVGLIKECILLFKSSKQLILIATLGWETCEGVNSLKPQYTEMHKQVNMSQSIPDRFDSFQNEPETKFIKNRIAETALNIL